MECRPRIARRTLTRGWAVSRLLLRAQIAPRPTASRRDVKPECTDPRTTRAIRQRRRAAGVILVRFVPEAIDHGVPANRKLRRHRRPAHGRAGRPKRLDRLA